MESVDVTCSNCNHVGDMDIERERERLSELERGRERARNQNSYIWSEDVMNMEYSTI